MINDIGQPNNPRNGKALAGIILLVVGAVLLVRQFLYIPSWIYSGPMWLIFIGAVIGSRNNFRKPASFLLIGLGVVLLINENVPHASGIIWPFAIIGFGLWMILRRHDKNHIGYFSKRYGNKWDWDAQRVADPAAPGASDSTYTAPPQPRGPHSYGPTGDDYLDIVSVFGGVKKTILSKDFKGGEIVNLFGGAEVDFTQADINGRVVVDLSQIFGGTKIIVPSHWQVVSDIAAVFAGIDDKRMRTTASLNSEKILVLTGFSVFAGVDIRSY